MALQDTIPSELRDAALSIVDGLDLPDLVAAGFGTAEEAVEKVAGSARQAAAQASSLGKRAGHAVETNTRPLIASASDTVRSAGKAPGTDASWLRTGARRWGVLIAVVGVLLLAAAIWRGAAAGKGTKPMHGQGDELSA
jgi:hypothetical protein